MKPIQICPVENTMQTQGDLVALCDDGSIWVHGYSGWSRLIKIPGQDSSDSDGVDWKGQAQHYRDIADRYFGEREQARVLAARVAVAHGEDSLRSVVVDCATALKSWFDSGWRMKQ